jgi:hypothetical protein
MKLKLLSPFQTNFSIVSELLIRNPQAYQQFWCEVSAKKERLRMKLGHLPSLSADLSEVHFPHQYQLSPFNRYRTLDSDSLERTIHVIELHLEDVSFLIKRLQENEDTALCTLAKGIIRLVCRIFDHGIGLLELDIDLGDQLQTAEASRVTQVLDDLQQTGVTMGEAAANISTELVLEPIFSWLYNNHEHEEANHFLESGFYQGKQSQTGAVLWVTRTLIFEEGDDANRDIIIRHWLIDSGGNEEIDGQTLVEKIIAEKDGHLTQWLNYLFREGSYQSLIPEKNSFSGTIKPFCDEWEAMLYSQFFYAALDIIDLHLTRILAYTLPEKPDINIDQQKKLLARNIRKTNLLLIQLHDSAKYYKRTVKAKLEEILAYWDFSEVLVDPVQRKIDLCQKRLSVLHAEEAARSSVYTDAILLGIGLTTIVSTLLALAEYGRTMANDVNLASYDVKSPNVIDLIAAQPTDVILVLSTALSVLLVIVYIYYRKVQVN